MENIRRVRVVSLTCILTFFLVRSVEGSCAEAQLCFDSCYKDRYGYLPVVAGFPQNQTVGTCHKLWPNTPHT